MGKFICHRCFKLKGINGELYVNSNFSGQTVLVIDDDDIVRSSFCDSLEDSGYKVASAKNGKLGLELIESIKPDLILTDLRMPVMGGIEFLSHSTAKFPHIPVIVISGAGLMGDVVDALHLGAFDYLTKPISDINLLQASVVRALEQVALKRENKNYQLHLEQLVEQRTSLLLDSNRELELHKNNLERLISERTLELNLMIDDLNRTQDQLIESAKMASLGRLVAGVSHELNTPLGICLTFVSSLGDKIKRFDQSFHQGTLRKEDFENFLSSAKKSSELVIHHLTQASDLVQNFKMVSVDISSDMERNFDLVDYISNVVESLKPELTNADVKVDFNKEQNFNIFSYPGFFSQIISNLIINSKIHGFASKEKGKIEIFLKQEGDNLIIDYQDDGVGMSQDVQKQIYEPFFSTTHGTGGSGLGMNILYNLVVGNLNGSVQCSSEIGQGAQFTVILPGLINRR